MHKTLPTRQGFAFDRKRASQITNGNSGESPGFAARERPFTAFLV